MGALGRHVQRAIAKGDYVPSVGVDELAAYLRLWASTTQPDESYEHCLMPWHLGRKAPVPGADQLVLAYHWPAGSRSFALIFLGYVRGSWSDLMESLELPEHSCMAFATGIGGHWEGCAEHG